VVVLLTGASGFIGRKLAGALHATGHQVVCAVRDPASGATPGCARRVAADFTSDLQAQDWLPRLTGVDAVINAVGILRETGKQTFEAIHVLAPQALFLACVTADVRRVIQISALGADEQARSRYHLSKRRADDFLSSLPLDWTIVQPSLVYGAGGASARLLTGLASLPWIPVPGDGAQRLQPVHLDDLVAAILELLRTEYAWNAKIALVGPEPVRLRDLLGRLRRAMALGGTRFVRVPLGVVRQAAGLGTLLPGSLLDRDTLDMLIRGNTGDPEPMRRLLGREARAIEEFILPSDAATVRTLARLAWLLPLLRWSIALVWIATGLISIGIYPASESYALLARVGVSGALAPVLLYGAALMDIAFGVATLLMRRRRLLWLAQAAAIVAYTLIITVRLPEFWLHPFGPLLKNVPLLAAIALLYHLERR
jgi:uncharacterized protein YbjT (DUF2867 family)